MRSAVKSGYGQDCPVARTLDTVGERWTFLILRDLLREGPRKFQDLEAKSRRHRSQHAVGAVETAGGGGGDDQSDGSTSSIRPAPSTF